MLRAPNSRGGSVVRKKKKSKKYTPSNYTTGKQGSAIGGYDPYNVSKNKGGGGSKYVYGAPRAVRNPQAEARARNDPRNRPTPPIQRVSRQTTIRSRPAPRISGGGGGGTAPSGGGSDSLDILDNLVQSMLSDSASQSFDYESALRQSQNAIRQAYGAEIGAIRSNNRAATRETRRDRREIEAMYAGLAKSYGQMANQSIREGKSDAAQQVALANQANKTIGANAKKSTGEEAKMLKDLGLEETADQIIAPDFKETRRAQNENTSRGARKAGVEKQLAGIDRDFFQQGGFASRTEGTNRSVDMLRSLQDYVRGNRNEIAVIAGKRAQDLAQNRTSTMQAAAEAESRADSEMWDRMMQVTGLRAQIEDTNFDNSLAAQKFKYTQVSDRRDRADRAAELAAKNKNSYLPQSLQNAMGVIQQNNANQPGRVTSILQSLFNSQAYRDGSVTRVQGKGAGAKNVSHKLTPAEAANMAERAAKQAGLSAKDIQIARLAAWASVEK